MELSVASFGPAVLVKVGAYRVGVRQAGHPDAPMVICVHGIGASGRYFVPFGEVLAKKYRVILLDLPGYGVAAQTQPALELTELAAVIHAYMVQENITATVLIGHSMGCQILAHLVNLYPERCSKLVLLGPTVYRSERTRWQQTLRLVQDMLHESPAINMMLLRSYWQMGLRRYLQTSRWMVNDAIEHTLAGCRLPILFVRGERDVIVPRAWMSDVAACVAHGTVRELPGAPHALQAQQPRELAAVCEAFFVDAV